MPLLYHHFYCMLCLQIISTFPKEWFVRLDEDKTLPQLENLGRFLVSAAKTLYTEGQSKYDFDRKDPRSVTEYRYIAWQYQYSTVRDHVQRYSMAMSVFNCQ